MKTIVTHKRPDVDAVTATWLLKTFFSGWHEAVIAFVPAGSTLEDRPADSDLDKIHVDTGLGRFDHHQSNADTCASKLVFEYLMEEKGSNVGEKDNNSRPAHDHWNEEALERLVRVINDIDHFRQVYWPEPDSDRYDLGFEAILDGWKLIATERGEDGDLEIMEKGFQLLDALYRIFINKVWAEKELLEKKIEFATPWGKGIALETFNDDCLTLALKKGWAIALRKDPHKGYVRIKSRPGKKVDLKKTQQELRKLDPEATWFLHASHEMLLNGSSKNPEMKVTKLSLEEIIDTLKKD